MRPLERNTKTKMVIIVPAALELEVDEPLELPWRPFLTVKQPPGSMHLTVHSFVGSFSVEKGEKW
jgi:hypothetical protein